LASGTGQSVTPSRGPWFRSSGSSAGAAGIDVGAGMHGSSPAVGSAAATLTNGACGT